MPEFLEPYTGHLAGVATALLWTGTSIFFTAAGRRIGPTAVNFSRMLFAIVLLGITHRLLSGGWLPDAVPRQIVFLAVSGLVGLTIGDQALFTAFVDIGPRLAILIMSPSCRARRTVCAACSWRWSGEPVRAGACCSASRAWGTAGCRRTNF